MSNTLELVVILLAVGVMVSVACHRLRLPPILGYLLVGIAVGPHALGWIPDAKEARYLAEFGVVFLMFSIGLEFSLPQLKAMRRIVFGLGLTQVGLTLAGGLAFAMLAGWGWQAGVVVGGALAMSSTAIVSKMLAERGELNTPQGRAAMGVLLFQDLAFVPLLIVIPELARGGTSLWAALGLAAVKAVVALSLLLVFGQALMRGWFNLVARQRSPELFMLNLLLVTLGLAWLTELAGLSLALGAFLAGMLIAETQYRYQVEEDIRPFRDVLLGLFFVTVGMQLDFAIVVDRVWWVLLALAVPIAVKLVLITGLTRAFGNTWGASLKTGFYLAQAGEFAFVLIAAGVGGAFLDNEIRQVILAAMLISMLLAPLLIQAAEPLARRLTANDWLARAAELTLVAARSMARQDHVLICGYGRSGQNLARMLDEEQIGYMAMDNDPERVREAAGSGGSVVYGDASRKEALLAAGLLRARALVITFTDLGTAKKILHLAREHKPDLPVIVRTVDDSAIDELLQAGATEVVPELMEGSLMLASHALLLLGTPLKDVLRRIRAVREERYGLFRGYFHGATDHAESDENLQPRLHSVVLPEGAAAIGKRVADLRIGPGVTISSVRRGGQRMVGSEIEEALQSGDVMVLLGTAAGIADVEQMLLAGD
ncbi:MAG: cation:proton antiporter [Betaproteobacteria bacterium]|nr:cation:proton antiporter [Betaproteobacteria bacterium]